MSVSVWWVFNLWRGIFALLSDYLVLLCQHCVLDLLNLFTDRLVIRAVALGLLRFLFVGVVVSIRQGHVSIRQLAFRDGRGRIDVSALVRQVDYS